MLPSSKITEIFFVIDELSKVFNDRIILKKRAVIETLNDELKNICQIEHARHRSFANFIINAYLCFSV